MKQSLSFLLILLLISCVDSEIQEETVFIRSRYQFTFSAGGGTDKETIIKINAEMEPVSFTPFFVSSYDLNKVELISIGLNRDSLINVIQNGEYVAGYQESFEKLIIKSKEYILVIRGRFGGSSYVKGSFSLSFSDEEVSLNWEKVDSGTDDLKSFNIKIEETQW